MIIAGSNDQAVGTHHARMLHEGIAGSRLVVFDGADHALLWSRPEAFVQAVETFLEA